MSQVTVGVGLGPSNWLWKTKHFFKTDNDNFYLHFFEKITDKSTYCINL